jgi:hypothetical protein
MAPRWHRSALIGAVLALSAASPAAAWEEREQSVATRDNGYDAEFTQVRSNEQPRPPARPVRRRAARPRDTCRWRFAPETPTGVPCGDLYVTPFWGDLLAARVRPAGRVGAGDTLYEQVLRRVEASPVTIGTAPDGTTIAGLPTYFWAQLTGPLQWTESALGIEVSISATVGAVTWDFDDGAVQEGGLGEPWPAHSRIRHAYRDTGTVDVEVDVELLGTWTSALGSGTLDPILVIGTRTLQIDQLQAVRVR